MTAAPASPSAMPAVTTTKIDEGKVENELARLLALERTERPPIQIEGGQLKIGDFNQAQRVANTILQAGTYPESWVKEGADHKKSLAAITLALLYGAESGFSLTQTMTCVYVVNGKPSLYGDGPIAKVRSSGLLHKITEAWEGSGDTLKCTVTVWRVPGPGGEIDGPHVRSFSAQDAKDQGLGGGTKWSLWKNKGSWRRMCQCRARAWVLRDVFPDVLMGLLIAEEYEGTEPERPVDTTISQRLVAQAAKTAAAPTPENPAPQAPKPEPAPAPSPDGAAFADEMARETQKTAAARERKRA